MKSIRFYLIVALIATVTLSNFIAAVRGYRNSMQETQALLDTLLADTATLLQAMEPPLRRQAMASSDRLAYQVWTLDGEPIIRSLNSGREPMTSFESGYRTENFADNRWRVLGLRDEKSGRWILVAERIDIRIALADSIILRSVLPIVISLPFIGIVVWLVVGNGLSLIKRLAADLHERRVDDLSPLQTSEPPVELAPVVNAINELLQRLDASVKRERRFSADAAHELRTPLASLKVHIHNLRKQQSQHSELIDVLDRDVERLSHLIEQMLLLYRTTPENYRAALTKVDLYALAQSVIADLFEIVDSKDQSIELIGDAQKIDGDPSSLQILLANLIVNASKYSPPGASILVSVQAARTGVEVVVRDTGPGLPLPELNRVLDRFYRAGGDRHASGSQGAGLGLSIVQHVAMLHNARLNIDNNEDGAGLYVSVLFPVAAVDEQLRVESLV